MTKNEKVDVVSTIDNEGFDYAFRHYSSFEEIKDKKFHDLRKQYIAICEEIEKYIEWEKYRA